MASHNTRKIKSLKNLERRIKAWEDSLTKPTNTTPRPNERNFTKPGSRKKS